MEFVLLNTDAQMPTRATSGSAGYDLYAMDDVTIPLYGQATIPTGVGIINVPKDVAGFIWPRSGTAHKAGIDRLAGLIDSDYSDGIGVILINHGDKPFHIKKGDRMAQIVFKNIILVANDIVISDDRDGGFGSTGK